MDYVSGTIITALSPIAELDIHGDVLAEEFFMAYLKQVLIDGFFHADPHPGNIFLADDGRLALLDLGITGRVSPNMQESLLRLLLAIIRPCRNGITHFFQGKTGIDFCMGTKLG